MKRKTSEISNFKLKNQRKPLHRLRFATKYPELSIFLLKNRPNSSFKCQKPDPQLNSFLAPSNHQEKHDESFLISSLNYVHTFNFFVVQFFMKNKHDSLNIVKNEIK